MNNSEANNELLKDAIQQIQDLIDETRNPLVNGADSERNNLDRIKHILKRIGFQQAAIDHKTSITNKRILVLSIIAAIPSLEIVIKFVRYLSSL